MNRPEIPAWILTLAALVSVVVLTITGHAIPGGLWALVGASGGGALAITAPNSSSSSTDASTSAALPPPPSS
jgi:hypothetical protein